MPDQYKARKSDNPVHQFTELATPHVKGGLTEPDIALVCPGPSLKSVETIDFAYYAAVFAVNYAALSIPKEFLTALYCLDGNLGHIWGDHWPHDLPRVHISHGPAKRMKAKGCANTFPLALADLLYRYPTAHIHLYGVDYQGRAVHTRCPWTPRRETTELPWVAGAWHPHAGRVTNHGTFDLELLEQYLTTQPTTN